MFPQILIPDRSIEQIWILQSRVMEYKSVYKGVGVVGGVVGGWGGVGGVRGGVGGSGVVWVVGGGVGLGGGWLGPCKIVFKTIELCV